MHAPFRPLHTTPKLPEQAINPPHLDDEEWERVQRNSIRQDAIEAANLLISRLDELDHDGHHRHQQKDLELLVDYLERDMDE